MSRAAQGVVTFAPVGDQIDNGYEMGGARNYPWSMGFALSPPAYYSDYIGTGTGLPVAVPAGSLPSTIGASPTSSSPGAVMQAVEHPFGRTSPLPWVFVGLIGGVTALWAVHYTERKGGSD